MHKNYANKVDNKNKKTNTVTGTIDTHIHLNLNKLFSLTKSQTPCTQHKQHMTS